MGDKVSTSEASFPYAAITLELNAQVGRVLILRARVLKGVWNIPSKSKNVVVQ